MSIKWNKVTWYSKLLAVIIFVLTFYVGLELGLHYQAAIDQGASADQANIIEAAAVRMHH